MAINEVSIPAVENLPNYGGQVSVFVPGVEVYGDLRIGREITVTTANEKTLKGTLQSFQVGALIDLMNQYGPQNILMQGRTYSALGFAQSMGESMGENPLDVTKLYTVVVIQMATPTPGMPSV